MKTFGPDIIDPSFMAKLNDIVLNSLADKSVNSLVSMACEKDDLRNAKKFSGKVVLKVIQGQLTNKEVSMEDRFVFNKIVFPQLLNFRSDIKEGFSGLIECHLRASQLDHIVVKENK